MPVCLVDDDLVLYHGCQSKFVTGDISQVTRWPENFPDQSLHPINCWYSRFVSGVVHTSQNQKTHVSFHICLGYLLPIVFENAFPRWVMFTTIV